MTTLDDKAILLGADNRPPMLEKDMYDSWKSKMELYTMNRQHGRMIHESVENAPLIWPTIEENGVTKPRKYPELTPADAIQADCDNKSPDEEVSKVVRKSDDYLIIKEWVSDSEEENVSQTKTKKKTVKPSISKIEFVKPKQQEKTARKSVKQVEKHRQNTHSPRGNQRNWNNMMSQRLGKLIFRDDLIYGPVM
ncbi:hypothetical protein Tco_0098491 [Tanacetum coccineum]